jgi:UDP-GlcNAc:undecaprenyl-phosphate GlcNAc-1-phosphate transferase
LLDGMDGMLGCVGFIITLAVAGMTVLGGNWAAGCVAAVLAGALLGFLRSNLPPASIFLGDAGSMLTGLVVGVLGIQSSLKGPATVALVAPLVLLSIPFLDTAAAVVRRKLTGRSIYATDRGHLHHCLLRRGFSVSGVLVLVSLLCGLTVLGVLASLALKNETIAVCSTLTVACVLVVTRLFGYAEFLLVRQKLARMVSSLLPQPGGRPQRQEVHLQGTGNWKSLMDAVTEMAPTLDLQAVCLDVSAPALHEHYHARWQHWEEKDDEVLWRAEVPLTIAGRSVGRLLVSGLPNAEPLWSKVAALCQLVEQFQSGVSLADQFARWRMDQPVTSLAEGPTRVRVPLSGPRHVGS